VRQTRAKPSPKVHNTRARARARGDDKEPKHSRSLFGFLTGTGRDTFKPTLDNVIDNTFWKEWLWETHTKGL